MLVLLYKPHEQLLRGGICFCIWCKKMGLESFLTVAKNYYLMAKRQQLFSFVVIMSINELGKTELPLHSDANFLARFTDSLPKHLRSYDVICHNGDEIYILLAGVDEKSALAIKNRIETLMEFKMHSQHKEHLNCALHSIYWIEEHLH